MILKDLVIPITNEIYKTCEPLVFISRIWGLFPFSVRRDGNKIMFKKSVFFYFYSYAMAFLLVFFIMRGLICDFRAGEKSVRMKTSLSVYVTLADVTIVAFTVFTGILAGPIHAKRFKTFIKNIVEVDKIIPLNDLEKTRKISIAVLSVILLFTCSLLSLDFWTWIRFANHSEDAEYMVTNYIPFYLAYFVVVLLECQYWFIIYSLQRRFHVITKLVSKDYYNLHKGVLLTPYNRILRERSNSDDGASNVHRPKYVNDIVQNVTNNCKKKIKTTSSNQNDVNYYFDFKAENLESLMKAYYKLSAAVCSVNSFCGVFLLVSLLSCLTHLVVTPYFLVMEINTRNDIIYVTLQCFWIFFHSCRIIGIVEPWHSFKQEERILLLSLSKLFFFEDGGEKFNTQTKNFFELVRTTDNYLSACGMARIDRNLITTIVGAVTTYLVILIQFQKSSP